MQRNLDGQVIYRLISHARNRELLQKIPYIPWLDLAVVFFTYGNLADYGPVAIQITTKQMREDGLTAEDLFRMAQSDTQVVLPDEFCSMHKILKESFPCMLSREGMRLYVLTNEYRHFGAAAILYDGQLSRIGRMLGENFYVLPSSVHEMLIVPASEAPARDAMKEIVHEINETVVERKDVLSDSVYFYDRACEALRMV